MNGVRRALAAVRLTGHPVLHRVVVAIGLILTLALAASGTDRVPVRRVFGTMSSATAGPTTTPTATATATATPTATGAPTVRTIRSAPPASAAGPGVAATYQTVAAIGGMLVCRISVRNVSGTAQGWQVRVAYPPSVGPLRGAWGGGTAVSADWYGNRLTVAGRLSLAPGAQVQVVAQFTIPVRRPGPVRPTGCTVNGTPCTIR